MSNIRSYYYTSILYPESAAEGWLKILEDEIVPMVISPLHDRDVSPTGEIKKAHYHLVLCFNSLKSHAQALTIFEKVNAVGIEVVKDIRSMLRYLTHMDYPDKFQYSEKDITILGSVDYDTIIESNADKYVTIEQMIDFIEDNNIIMFNHLVNYARHNNRSWFRSLTTTSTFFIKEYLKSKEYEQKQIQ